MFNEIKHYSLNEQITKLSRLKKALWHSNQRTKWKCASLVKEYKKVLNGLKKEIRYAIKAHELTLASDKKNPKRLFSYINRKQTIKPQISTIRDKNNIIQTDGN